MDELKIRVWDYLYRLGRAQQLAIIAEQMDETPQAIRQAVDDPWFELDEQQSTVAIARHKRDMRRQI